MHLLGKYTAELPSLLLQALQLLFGVYNFPLEGVILFLISFSGRKLLLYLFFRLFQRVQLGFGVADGIRQKALFLLQQLCVGRVQLEQPFHLLQLFLCV